MLLSDIFDDLTYGELSQMAIGGSSLGSIQEEDYPKIISNINVALSLLYTTFVIREREMYIQEYDGQTMYKLDSEYAVSNTDSTATPKYILDSDTDPFTDDIVMISRAYDELGEEIPLNDFTRENSIFLPSYNTLQIPKPVSSNTMSLIYQSKAAEIPTDTIDLSYEVDLPDYFRLALLYYSAARIYSSMNSAESSTKAGFLYGSYQQEVQRIKDLNLVNDNDTVTNTKFGAAGWV